MFFFQSLSLFAAVLTVSFLFSLNSLLSCCLQLRILISHPTFGKTIVEADENSFVADVIKKYQNQQKQLHNVFPDIRLKLRSASVPLDEFAVIKNSGIRDGVVLEAEVRPGELGLPLELGT